MEESKKHIRLKKQNFNTINNYKINKNPIFQYFSSERKSCDIFLTSRSF